MALQHHHGRIFMAGSGRTRHNHVAHSVGFHGHAMLSGEIEQIFTDFFFLL